MKLPKDNILYVVVFSFVVCGLFVSGLAVANELTKDAVEANQVFAAQSAVLDALGIRFADRAEALSLYQARVREVAGALPRAYEAELDGARAIAVEMAGPGLWGTIVAVVAADADLSRIRGIQILSQNETPGLGGRIDEPWFKAQFRGERMANGKIRVTSGAEAKGSGDADPANALVDGISGATRTTQAMERIVNDALARVGVLAGGGK